MILLILRDGEGKPTAMDDTIAKSETNHRN